MSRTTIPRPAASTLVVRDHICALQVMVVRRSLTASFMPGSYVFPGGAVDDADSSAQAEARCNELRAEASRRVGFAEPANRAALASMVAALRECFEECGLWLGVDRPVDARTMAAARRRMLSGAAEFCALSAELELPLATTALAPWSHWVTPIDMPKRFDTLFFVALAPADQVPAVDDGEAIGVVWVSPAEALSLHAAGELPLEFATQRTLESLLPFDSASTLMQAARRPRRIEANHPRVARTRVGEQLILLPRDAGYTEVMRLDPEGTGAAVLPAFDAPVPALFSGLAAATPHPPTDYKRERT